ncbi:MAG: UDP-N-acetylenolpyruvoylglucosamine reductase [Chlamydiae bacterium]|nr:UDP-N-acetylenolpyruvoylglucosamine reductase [Chlamydiota bacterium]
MSSKKLSSIWTENVSLAPYSTYKIGGCAKLFAEVSSKSQLKEALLDCKQNQIRCYILGKGSNTLFDDRGFDGAVILNKIDFIERDGTQIYAGGGASFAKLGHFSAKLNLSGLEFAAGVPGSVGGAVYMNAGAHAQEVKDVIEEVEFLDLNGQEHCFDQEELVFKYRWSIFHYLKGVITAVHFKLKTSPDAYHSQKHLLSLRQKTQPLQENSCGCVFRNLHNVSAGALIENLGLKGKQIGGAQVSTLHANFIVNTGGAKAQDVLDLVDLIELSALKKLGLSLKKEIRFLPYEGCDD